MTVQSIFAPAIIGQGRCDDSGGTPNTAEDHHENDVAPAPCGPLLLRKSQYPTRGEDDIFIAMGV